MLKQKRKEMLCCVDAEDEPGVEVNMNFFFFGNSHASFPYFFFNIFIGV